MNVPGRKRDLLGREVCLRLRHHGNEPAFQLFKRGLTVAHHRLDVIQKHVCRQHAESGQRRGCQGNQDPSDVEGARQFAGMHASGSAERKQHVIPGIVPALDRRHANRPFHLGIDHLEDAQGNLLQVNVGAGSVWDQLS